MSKTNQRYESAQREIIRNSSLAVDTGPMLEKISLETLLSGDLATPRLDGNYKQNSWFLFDRERKF